MSERLTRREDSQIFFKTLTPFKVLYEEMMLKGELNGTSEITIQKLCAYEDIGTVEQFAEWAKAEKDGRLKIKPQPRFNVGDSVRIIDAMDTSFIGRVGKITAVSNHWLYPITYAMDIAKGHFTESMLEAAEASKGEVE